jgi:hypothetical protein
MITLEKTDYNQYEYVDRNENVGINTEELRSKYIEQYCSMKGWDSSSLKNEQLAEIINSSGYKRQGIILS